MPSAEYICVAAFSDVHPDLASWEGRFLDLGLQRESFSMVPSPSGKLLVKFWEQDRPEAFRILEELDYDALAVP